MFNLRNYQIEAKNAILNEWKYGNKNTLLVLPTGTGKTVVFSAVAKEVVNHNNRVLILAHREELLDQAMSKINNIIGLQPVLEKASKHSYGSEIPITVASIQSLCRPNRLYEFPKDYFKTIIIDEAHHALSDSYQRVLKYFNDANLLGVTATPDRGDHKLLAEYFDSIAYEYSLRKAVKDGNLVNIEAQMIPIKIDLSSTHITQGDFNSGDVSHALDPYLEKIATEMYKYCKDKKTVVFLPLIATSQKFCKILNRIGFKAAEINGTSSDREEILKDFENGKYNVLCNAMLLIEGWDCPSVDCIVVLRPTKIRSLYQQMVGRGMRLYPGKDKLLLLDFLWLTERHDLCKPATLIAKNKEIAERMNMMIDASEVACDLISSESNAEKDIIALREQHLRNKLAAESSRDRKIVDPINYGLMIHNYDIMDYKPRFDWENNQPTKKQLSFLEHRGFDISEIKSAGFASAVINAIIERQHMGLSTPKQIKVLTKFGFHNVDKWSFTAATNLITKLASQNWRLNSIDPDKYYPN